MKRALFCLLLVILTSCATTFPFIAYGERAYREKASDSGKNVKLLESINSSCRFIGDVKTKIFIHPYPLLAPQKVWDEEQAINVKEATVRLQNRAGMLGANVISDLKEIDDFSNWDRSKPYVGKAYDCK